MSTINKPKIILTGTYSSFNKGDAAMQLSTAQQIKALWPDAEIIISSPFPAVDIQTYKDYQVIKSTRRNLIFSTLQIFRAKLYTALKRIKIEANFIANNEELKYFRQADLVIDLSGDTITEDYGPHVTYSHLLPIWLAESLKIPVFACAQSIGPFKITKAFVKRILNKVTFITTREEITYKYLSGIGIDKKILTTTSDMAFLLKPSTKNEVGNILKKEKISLGKKPLLGVTVSNLVEKRFNKANPDGGDFIATIAKALDSFIEKRTAQIIFIGHVTGPSDDKNDRLVANRVKASMKNKNSVSVLKGNYNPSELKGIIALCDLLMGSRMHSNIGAISSLIPTLAIAYSHKTQGIMSLIGMSKFVHNIDRLDAKSLSKDLDEVFANRSRIKAKLSKEIPKIKFSSSKNVQIIENIIEENSL